MRKLHCELKIIFWANFSFEILFQHNFNVLLYFILCICGLRFHRQKSKLVCPQIS